MNNFVLSVLAVVDGWGSEREEHGMKVAKESIMDQELG